MYQFILLCLKTLEISCGQRLRFCPSQKSAWNSCILCLQIFMQAAFTAQKRNIHERIDNSWTEDILCCMVQEIKHMHGSDSLQKKNIGKMWSTIWVWVGQWVEGHHLFSKLFSFYPWNWNGSFYLCNYFHFKSFNFIGHGQVLELHGNM